MSRTEEISKKTEKFPILEGILPINKAQIPLDIIAGITLAALAIPEVMGYAKIAGVPVVLGLYTILIPIAVFALFGSSRHLVVGADSATAAILATTLITMAYRLPQYIALAGMRCLLAAILLILSRILKLGFIADFLSRAVLIGFLTGVGIQVALGQFLACSAYRRGEWSTHAGRPRLHPGNSPDEQYDGAAFNPCPDHHLYRGPFPEKDTLGTPCGHRHHHCVLGF